MRISKEEKEFKELFTRVLDHFGYLSDDDPKPSPPVTKLLVDQDKQLGAAIAIDDHHHHKEEEDDQGEYLMKMRKPSEHKPPAIVDDHYRSTPEFEEPAAGKLISLMLPAKKRPFSSEYNQEEEETMHNKKKKIKTEEISCCSANPPPELPREFTHVKNKAWGSSFTNYFVKENNFVDAKKPKKKTNKKISTRDSPPPLPQKYREKVNAMQGSEPVLVIQKRLFNSDLTQQLNRLSIPHKQIMAKFLTDEEKENLKKNLLEVTLIDPRLVEWTLNMKQWNMNSSVYVLITNWYKLVEENEKDLKEGTEVQLWSFRVGTKLCFILVRLNFCAHLMKVGGASSIMVELVPVVHAVRVYSDIVVDQRSVGLIERDLRFQL
ncbi:hypothetical protein LguiA_012486 [Lonicera macranthoides]